MEPRTLHIVTGRKGVSRPVLSPVSTFLPLKALLLIFFSFKSEKKKNEHTGKLTLVLSFRSFNMYICVTTITVPSP